MKACNLLYEYELNDEEDEFFRKALSEKSNKLKINTLYELNELITNTEADLPEDIVKLLYKLIEKSNDRSVVVGCLNVLQSTGNETQGSSLMRIDDWKEKNCDYW